MFPTNVYWCRPFHFSIRVFFLVVDLTRYSIPFRPYSNEKYSVTIPLSLHHNPHTQILGSADGTQASFLLEDQYLALPKHIYGTISQMPQIFDALSNLLIWISLNFPLLNVMYVGESSSPQSCVRFLSKPPLVPDVIGSYQQSNNTYTCDNSRLLNGVLKDELRFQGFVQKLLACGVEAVLSGLDITYAWRRKDSLEQHYPTFPS